MREGEPLPLRFMSLCRGEHCSPVAFAERPYEGAGNALLPSVILCPASFAIFFSARHVFSKNVLQNKEKCAIIYQLRYPYPFVALIFGYHHTLERKKSL